MLLFILLFGVLFFVACGQFNKTSSQIPETVQIDTTNHPPKTENQFPDTAINISPINAKPYETRFSSLPDSLKIHVLWGIPYDKDSTDDYLIFRTQYALSYNNLKGVPNWASWELDSSWFGNSGRYKGKFITEFTLPDTFYKPGHDDYTNTGFDRGHVVQSHERSRSEADNKATFFMSNVMPQKPDLNRGVWLKFENFCKSLCVDSGYKLLIVAGGVYHQNNTLNNLGKIAIPDSCFKIVLTTKNTLSDIDSSTHVYAVMMPNIQGIRKDEWRKYSTTIRQIEISTGYDFFNELPKQIQEYLENK